MSTRVSVFPLPRHHACNASGSLRQTDLLCQKEFRESYSVFEGLRESRFVEQVNLQISSRDRQQRHGGCCRRSEHLASSELPPPGQPETASTCFLNTDADSDKDSEPCFKLFYRCLFPAFSTFSCQRRLCRGGLSCAIAKQRQVHVLRVRM